MDAHASVLRIKLLVVPLVDEGEMKVKMTNLMCIGFAALLLVGCGKSEEVQKKEKVSEVMSQMHGGNGCTKIRTPDEVKRGVPCN